MSIFEWPLKTGFTVYRQSVVLELVILRDKFDFFALRLIYVLINWSQLWIIKEIGWCGFSAQESHYFVLQTDVS